MGRKYNVTFTQISIAAVQDLLQIKCPSNRSLRILRQWLEVDDGTLPAAQTLGLRSQTYAATVTDGSGGGSPTISQCDPGDTNATFTALRNSTTKATTTGTKYLHYVGGFYVFIGHERMFRTPPPLLPNESFVFELIRAPAAAIVMSGGVEVEEVGG